MEIRLKTAEEIEKIRVAGQIAAEALTLLGSFIEPGITTDEINAIGDKFIRGQGAYPASLGYHGFPKSLCTSVNHVVCHGIPGDKKLKAGDIINVDIVVEKEGFYGDTSKMFFVGTPSVLAKRLVDVTQQALILGIKMIKPGVRLGDIGAAIQAYAEKNHYSIVREYCGHGVGFAMHEEPQVLHYGESSTGIELTEGMVFTLEPMINAGKRHIKLLPDQWTVITKDRSLSAQWEHTIAVTADGYDVLTRREEETW